MTNPSEAVELLIRQHVTFRAGLGADMGLQGVEAAAAAICALSDHPPQAEGEAVGFTGRQLEAEAHARWPNDEHMSQRCAFRDGAYWAAETFAHPAPQEGVEAVREKVIEAAKLVFAEKRPSYHDCIDNGEPQCAWCDLEEALAALRPSPDSADGTSNK